MPGLKLFDGSGLSPQNRVAAITLARLLADNERALYHLLPLGGREGTLEDYDFTTALGRVRAKSGHLTDVSALAGYVTTVHHGRVAFAFLIDGSPGDPDSAIVRAVDRLAVFKALERCWIEDLLSRLLGRALRHGGEFADVFCERRRTLSFRLQDGRIHEASYGVTLGVGIRVVIGESAGYAFSDDLSAQALLEAADAASLIARNAPAGEAHAVDLSVEHVASFYDGEPPGEFDANALRRQCWRRADVAARRYDPRVVAVNAHVSDEMQEVWIATSDGRFVHDRRPLVTLGVQVVASDKKERGSGYVGDGGRDVAGLLRSRDARSARGRGRADCDGQRFRSPGAGRRNGDDRRRGRRRRAAARGGRDTGSKAISTGAARRSTAGESANALRANS